MPEREGPYHHGNLREALIGAALELLAERGKKALSLREVARRAGVSHAAPYRHFADRAELLSAIAEHGFAELERELSLAGSSLAAVASAYVGFALAQPARFRLMFEPEQAGSVASRSALAPLRRALGCHPPSRSAELVAWATMHGIAVLGSERWLEAEPGALALAEHAASLLAGEPARSRRGRDDFGEA
jgi:AcrR family transcriptional regulator